MLHVGLVSAASIFEGTWRSPLCVGALSLDFFLKEHASDMVAHTCKPSTLWGGAEAGGSQGQEIETILANMVKLLSIKK